MRKRMIVLIGMMIVIFGTGCGENVEDKIAVFDEDEYEDEYEDEENIESENESDTAGIQFADTTLERYVRKSQNNLSGTLTEEDVAKITSLTIYDFNYPELYVGIGYGEYQEGGGEMIKMELLERNSYDTWDHEYSTVPIAGINTYEDLKYFTGLQYLKIVTLGDTFVYLTNIDFINYMPQLKEVCIRSDAEIESYEPLLDLENLTKVGEFYESNSEQKVIIETFQDRGFVYDDLDDTLSRE